MANIPRDPIFIPRQPSRPGESFTQGSPTTLTVVNPPKRPSYQGWPRSCPRHNPDRYTNQFTLGTPNTLTTIYRPRLQPFQFWPEQRRPYNADRYVAQFDYNTPNTLTAQSPPRYQPFQFWPDTRPPYKIDRYTNQFSLGSFNTLGNTNPKPVQSKATLQPEIRFPVVPQPYIQGSPTPLLRDIPIGQRVSQSLTERPVRPFDVTRLAQGSPQTLIGVTTASGAGTLSGTGTLAAIGQAIFQGVGAASGVGTVNAAGSTSTSYVLNSTIGDFTSSSTATVLVQAALNQTFVVTSAATATVEVHVVVNATIGDFTSTITLSSIATTDGAGTLTGTGTLAATGRAIDTADGALSGTGTLAGTGISVFAGVGSLSGSGTLSATGRAIDTAAGSASGTGTVNGVSSTVTQVNCSLDATIGDFTCVGRFTLTGIRAAVATLTGVGSLSAQGVDANAIVIVPEQPSSGGVSAPPFRLEQPPLPVDVFIEGVILGINISLIPGNAFTVSLLPGSVVVDAMAIESKPFIDSVRLRFVSVGKAIVNDDVIDDYINDLLIILDEAG